MSNSPKILLVEDDESLGFVIKDNLEVAGYAVEWKKNGRAGQKAYQEESFDICVLDVMLPKMDGFSLLHEIRIKDQYVPIIMLTAKNTQEDVLTGFRNGADDYVIKPFDMEELLMRIRVFLKRTIPRDQKQRCYQIRSFELDTDNLLLRREGSEDQKLTEREGLLLELFCQQLNSVIKREYILENIWGENDYFLGRSLDVFISRLRKYLRPDDGIEIVNHHGVGFKLVVKA